MENLPVLLCYQNAFQIFLVAYEQLPINQCEWAPVRSLLQQFGASQRFEAGWVRLYSVQHLAPVRAQKQTVDE